VDACQLIVHYLKVNTSYFHYFIMAACQLTGRWPLYFAIVVCSFFSFFWLIITKFCLVIGGDPDLQMYITDLGSFPPKKLGGPKTPNFSRISDNLGIWSRISLDCNKISPIWKCFANYDHFCTWLLNLANFGLQMAKNRTTVLTPPESTFSDVYLIWGTIGRCPLKCLQMLKHDQGLLMH